MCHWAGAQPSPVQLLVDDDRDLRAVLQSLARECARATHSPYSDSC